MLAGGVIAGFVAGLLAALLHFAFIQNTLLLGEDYESGAAVHWAGVATDTGAAEAADTAPEPGAEAEPAAEEDNTFTRNALTVLFTGLNYAGYGLLLIAAMQVPGLFGKTVSARDGVLWGLAGFAAFQMLPSMGLPAQLPGTLSADVQLRQIWWVATIVSAIAGLGLLAYGRGVIAIIVAVALLAAPHLIGAPSIEGYYGYAPPELGAEFATRVLGVGMVSWAFLGWLVMRVAPPQEMGEPT